MRRLLFSLVVGLSLLGCGGDSAATPAATAGSTGDASIAPAPDPAAAGWRAYPEVGENWDTRPLDDARWVAASGDLGCIGRAHHGDPGSHRAVMARVLAHHATTADEVMSYGIAVNKGPKAGELGAAVDAAVQGCK